MRGICQMMFRFKRVKGAGHPGKRGMEVWGFALGPIIYLNFLGRGPDEVGCSKVVKLLI